MSMNERKYEVGEKLYFPGIGRRVIVEMDGERYRLNKPINCREWFPASNLSPYLESNEWRTMPPDPDLPEKLRLRYAETVNQELQRIGGGEDSLIAKPVDASYHLVEITNRRQRGNVQVFNVLSTLQILRTFANEASHSAAWDALVAADPRAPINPNHYNVTFLGDERPYLEWRWVGNHTIERRRVPDFSEYVPYSEWNELRTSEVYYHLSVDSLLGEWLKIIGFTLPEAEVERWRSFIAGPEEILWTTTGPALIDENQECELPDKGWCRVTKIEQIPYSSDKASNDEIDKAMEGADEWVYYGHVIEP
jgi:hypothetical protein